MGIVIVMSGFRSPNLLAIKLGRKGDLTGTDASRLDESARQLLHGGAGAARRHPL